MECPSIKEMTIKREGFPTDLIEKLTMGKIDGIVGETSGYVTINDA